MASNAFSASVKKNGIFLIAVWSIIIGLLASVTIYAHHNDTIKEAESEANTYFKLNLSYREWASKMGGVYASTDKVAPNPYLQVPNRDVTTSDNRRLTLVNPAYMTRMVFESIQASSPEPIINKITSLKPLNPANAPDEWERQSLLAFESQQYKERSEVTTIDGKPYLRFISMFITEESCLKCHAHQGYRKGDVRGAITISVPLTKSFELQQRTDNKILGGYFVLWMLGTIGIVISSRRREHAGEIMSESENRYRSLFHKAGEGICIMSQKGELINVNESFAKGHGYEEREMLGMNIRDLDVHGGIEEYPERMQSLLSGNTIEFEVEHYHKNGHIFPLEVKVSLISLGGETFSLCFHRDITERRRVEYEREQFHTFFNISSDLMCVANITGNFIKMNSVWEKTLGFSEEELLSKPFIDFVHPDDVDNTLSVVQNNLLHGIPVYSFENRYICKDGTYKWLSWTSNPIPAEGITYAIARDITNHKQLELEREQFYTFFNNSSDLMCIADPNGAFKKTNPAFTEILGYSKEELISKPFIDFVHTDDKQSTLDEMARQQQIGSSFAFQNRYLCKDGSVRWLSWRADYNKDENLTYATARDITYRKKAEEEERERELQLQQTQKLESLGVLSGGIAHDFNNILAIIMGNCSLAKMDAKNADKFIPEIEKASERAAELCRQMLAYAGKSQFVQAKVNVRSLVADTVSMLKKTVPQNAEIKFDSSVEIPFIQGDASQLSQIVMNLIINASEAIGTEQGEVRVSLSETMIHKGQSDKDYNGKAITPGRYVCLEVTDNGCGMDEKTKWRIFEPFYTTKFTGRGLGMSAVLGIIMSHKGALQLFSELGKGTAFKVYFATKDFISSGKEKQNQVEVSTPWQGSGTILLAEDEDQIRPLAKTMLNALGFTVIEAVNGKEALDLYHKNVADITIVLTDLGMPIMDGYALFSELKRLNPELPIIISSGFGEGEVTARIPSFEIAGLINKPYNFSMLQEVLKSVMEEAKSSNMHQITEVVQQTSYGAHASAKAATELHGNAEELQRLVHKFKL